MPRRRQPISRPHQPAPLSCGHSYATAGIIRPHSSRFREHGQRRRTRQHRLPASSRRHRPLLCRARHGRISQPPGLRRPSLLRLRIRRRVEPAPLGCKRPGAASHLPHGSGPHRLCRRSRCRPTRAPLAPRRSIRRATPAPRRHHRPSTIARVRRRAKPPVRRAAHRQRRSPSPRPVSDHRSLPPMPCQRHRPPRSLAHRQWPPAPPFLRAAAAAP